MSPFSVRASEPMSSTRRSPPSRRRDAEGRPPAADDAPGRGLDREGDVLAGGHDRDRRALPAAGGARQRDRCGRPVAGGQRGGDRGRGGNATTGVQRSHRGGEVRRQALGGRGGTAPTACWTWRPRGGGGVRGARGRRRRAVTAGAARSAPGTGRARRPRRRTRGAQGARRRTAGGGRPGASGHGCFAAAHRATVGQPGKRAVHVVARSCVGVGGTAGRTARRAPARAHSPIRLPGMTRSPGRPRWQPPHRACRRQR